MSATMMVRQWQRTVKCNLLPDLHAHQAKALGLLSWTMAMAGSCCAGQIAPLAPAGAAKPASVRRRMERLLANPRLDAVAAMLQLTGSILKDWSRPDLLLILDETPKANDLRCMRLSIAYCKRSIPLLSLCYAPDHPPTSMPRLIRRMLRQVATQVPQQTTVTLLADRGLCWPTILRQCRRLGWHYLIRMQSDTRIQRADGTIVAAGELASRVGMRWIGQDVRVFKKAGWMPAHVLAVWEARCKEPWLLVSDQPACLGCCRRYCKRIWCEQTHRDDKSHGLNWQKSQVSDPAHAQRLMLLMSLANLLCILTGATALKRGLRRLFEPRLRRLCSVFQLGKRCLEYSVIHEHCLVQFLALPPP